MYTITIFQDAAGKWRWRMKASNGRIVADSAEGYARRLGAYDAAMRLLNARMRLRGSDL